MIPDVVRTDRGPEMTSAVNAEFLALLSVKHVVGAAFTPRHQGPGERAHQTIMNNETAKNMAVLCASGCYLPRGLTFGPTNGPEDFQELVFMVFQRKLYTDWFLFLDDLTIATGRPSCLGQGPSGAADATDTNLTFSVGPEVSSALEAVSLESEPRAVEVLAPCLTSVVPTNPRVRSKGAEVGASCRLQAIPEEKPKLNRPVVGGKFSAEMILCCRECGN